MSEGTLNFREQMAYLPQPVAVALGRLLRSGTLPEQLDAAIKAAEVVTRYVATIALASYASRTEDGDPAEPLTGLSGPLSFGHYLSLIKNIVARSDAHPLEPQLAAGFRRPKSGRKSPAGGALDNLIELRNREGHDLRHLDEAKALVVSRQYDPLGELQRALAGLRPLLALPLFVVEQQHVARGTVTATVLLLEGENLPFPEKIDLGTDIHHARTPYLGTRDGILNLSPGITWDLVERHETFGLFFLDRVDEHEVRHKAIADGSQIDDSDELLAAVQQQLAGPPSQAEAVLLVDGRSLARWWGERSRAQFAVPTMPDQGTDTAAASDAAAGAEVAALVAEPSPPIAPPPDPAAPPANFSDETAPDETAVSNRSTLKVQLSWESPTEDSSLDGTAEDPRLTEANLLRWIASEDRSVEEIADALGLRRLWVKRSAEAHGLATLLKVKVVDVEPAVEQIERYEAGEDIGPIAVELCVAQSTALRALVRYGAELRTPDSERIGGRQPSVSRAYLLREYVQKQRTLEDIGQEVGLTRERVRQLREQYGISPVDRTRDLTTVVSRALLRQLYVVQGLSLDAISQQVGLSKGDVADLARTYDLARPRVYERSGLTKDLLEELYLERHMSMGAIARERQVPQQAVNTALVRHGIPIRSRRAAVGRGLHKVLTKEYLEQRLAGRATITAIAEDHGCTTTTINSYLEAAGLRASTDPDPRWDDLLSVGRLQRDYLDSDRSLAEYAASIDAPQAEVRLRMKLAGLTVPRRRNSAIAALPTPTEVRAAMTEGPVGTFPIPTPELAELYVAQGRACDEIASMLSVERSDVLRTLCAAHIEVRTEASDILSEPFLRSRYVEDQLSATKIAAEVGTTGATVTKHLKRYGIAVRGHVEAGALKAHGDRPELSAEFLRKEYVDGGRSGKSIGDEVGTDAKTVLDAVRAAGLPVRQRTGGPGSSSHLRSVLTPEFLHEELIVKGRSIRAIAIETGTTNRTVHKFADESGIDLPSPRAPRS